MDKFYKQLDKSRESSKDKKEVQNTSIKSILKNKSEEGEKSVDKGKQSSNKLNTSVYHVMKDELELDPPSDNEFERACAQLRDESNKIEVDSTPLEVWAEINSSKGLDTD
jgi:hypothetical protein